MINKPKHQKILYQFDTKFVSTETFSEFGTSFDVAKKVLVIGAPSFRTKGVDIKGRVFVYEHGELTEQLSIYGFSDFGRQVTISPNGYRIACLAFKDKKAAIIVFRKKERWELESTIPLEVDTTRCTLYFSNDSTRLFVVLPRYVRDNEYVGAILVYRLGGTKWKFEMEMLGEPPEFGWFSTRSHQSTILVANPEGKLYLFNTETRELQKFHEFQRKTPWSCFDVSEKWVIASYPLLTKSTTHEVGEVEVYRRENNNLVLYSTIGEANCGFGYCVKLHDDHLLVGASRYRTSYVRDVGAIVVYDLRTQPITPVQLILPPTLSKGGHFGAWFRINNDTLWVGCPFIDDWSGVVFKYRKIEGTNKQ